GSVTSSVATVSIGVAPAITQPPSDLVVTQGQDATLTLAASGDAPLSYQWRFNAQPANAPNSSSFTIVGATPLDAGSYDAIVSNPYGAITSAVAHLSVLVPPAITSQPTNQTVAPGSDVSLQVTATGSAPLSYQWWFSGTNAIGTNVDTLTLTNAQSAQA